MIVIIPDPNPISNHPPLAPREITFVSSTRQMTGQRWNPSGERLNQSQLWWFFFLGCKIDTAVVVCMHLSPVLQLANAWNMVQHACRDRTRSSNAETDAWLQEGIARHRSLNSTITLGKKKNRREHRSFHLLTQMISVYSF